MTAARFVLVAACVAVAVGVPALAGSADSRASAAPVVAVFPFKVLNDDPSLAHLGEGAAEAVINKIVNDKSLRMVEESQLDKAVSSLARNQSGLFEEESALRIGAMVDARFIVIGSVQVMADQVAVSARLLEVETRELLASERMFGPKAATFQTTDELAARLLTKMTEHLAERISDGGSADAVAVRQLIDEAKGFDPIFPPAAGVAKDLSRAKTIYDKAVLRDPKSPMALRALGHAESRLADELATTDASRAALLLANARDHLAKATAADASNAFAFVELGRCEGRLQNHAAARAAFEHALRLDDTLADAHFGLGVALLKLGQLKGAQEHAVAARNLGQPRAEGLLAQIEQLQANGRAR